MSVSLRSVSLGLTTCALFMITAPVVSADTMFTMTGDFRSVYNDSYAFDGTDFTDLPGLFDGLIGGTFRATYFVPTVVPPTDPTFNFASYRFPAPYGMTFTLYNRDGVAVTQGRGDTTYASATVSNNVPVTNSSGNLLGLFDEVELAGYPGELTGLQKPTALYGTPDFFIGYSSFRFNNLFGPYLPDLLNSLNLPTNAATYLSFPSKTFTAGAFWGSGDYNDQGNPFQYDDSHIYYDIRGITSITAVPEPGTFALLLGFGVSGVGLLMRRRN